ncbi:hypothetical protein OHA74_12155 [Streptomyces phaeochromogenes]|uniref:hypothetical protein n=1 Tax=Streptomyces phaeochromogenes TaxID=1923 RepID=UPI002E2B48D6|nr:hypothetical protein [Streptomyces phaeochromogenes]
MIAILHTLWDVSAASYAEANGIDEADVPRELGGYASACINDIPALADSDGWARCLHTPDLPDQLDGRVRQRIDWRVAVTATSWLAARGLDQQTARTDLLAHLAWDLYHLPSICVTDAVMTATYAVDGRETRREFRPDDRRTA